MPTNDKEYMNNYMKTYNINEKAKIYYHKHKNNPDYSHYLPYRLELQRQYYKEKLGKEPRRYTRNEDKKMKINNGYYEIKFN
jgi:hypothetical protein